MTPTSMQAEAPHARLAFLGVAFAFLVTMLGTTLPTPLYPVYQQRFGFSQLIVTVIFAAYAVGVIAALLTTGRFELGSGRDLLLVAGLQVISYPFHDPVLTDRGFITSPKVMVKGFVLAGLISGAFILLFSSVGLYARAFGLEGSAVIAAGTTSDSTRAPWLPPITRRCSGPSDGAA